MALTPKLAQEKDLEDRFVKKEEPRKGISIQILKFIEAHLKKKGSQYKMIINSQ